MCFQNGSQTPKQKRKGPSFMDEGYRAWNRESSKASNLILLKAEVIDFGTTETKEVLVNALLYYSKKAHIHHRRPGLNFCSPKEV